MKCPGCGADVKSRFCTYCGRELPHDNAQNVAGDNSQQTIINNYYYGENPATRTVEPAPQQNYYQYNTYNTAPAGKDRIVALILCILLGGIGAHYFYVGRFGMGLLYLFTGGLFGFGWLIDLIRIALGKFPGVR